MGHDRKKIVTIPPQSHLRRARCYPHIRQCTVPLRVLAVACIMRKEALRKRYRALRDVMEALGLRERYGALTKRYGTVMKNIDFAPH